MTGFNIFVKAYSTEYHDAYDNNEILSEEGGILFLGVPLPHGLAVELFPTHFEESFEVFLGQVRLWWSIS